MTELTKRLRLDLSDTLSGNVELLADFFKGSRSSVIKAESEPEDFLLPLSQCSQHFLELLAQKCESSSVRRYRNIVILDKITQMAVFLFADGRLKRNGLLGDLEDLAYSLYRDFHSLRDLFGSRFSSELLKELSAHSDQFVDGLDHMNGNTDRSGLICDCSCNSLADPPCSVCREFKALIIIEFLYCLD